MKNSLILCAQLLLFQSFFPAQALCMTIDNDISIAKKIIIHTDSLKYRSYTVASQECPKTAIALYKNTSLAYSILSIVVQYLDRVKTVNIPYEYRAVTVTYWALAGGPTFGQVRKALNLTTPNNGEQTIIEYTSRDNEDEHITDFTGCSSAQEILNANKNYTISSIKIAAIPRETNFFRTSKLY